MGKGRYLEPNCDRDHPTEKKQMGFLTTSSSPLKVEGKEKLYREIVRKF